MTRSLATPEKRAVHSMSSFPICRRLAATGPTLITISPLRTYSIGTRVLASTTTVMWGVEPLSTHHSYTARNRYGLVDLGSAIRAAATTRESRNSRVGLERTLSFAHHLLRRRQCLDERGAGEEALCVLHERRGCLRQGHAVVVEPPQERADRHVEHRELVSQHVLLLGEHRRHLRKLVGNVLASAVLLLLVAVLERLDVGKKLHFELEQK